MDIPLVSALVWIFASFDVRFTKAVFPYYLVRSPLQIVSLGKDWVSPGQLGNGRFLSLAGDVCSWILPKRAQARAQERKTLSG